VPTPVDTTGEDPVFASDDPAGVLEELAKCLRPLLDGLPPDQR
jgi:DNA-directed RNA polymerase specialized sigma24 family protein